LSALQPPTAFPRLYHELADWFHLLSPPEEYVDEARLYRDCIREVIPTGPCRLLELGAGAGSNASHLTRDFECTLTDLSGAMLEASRVINPGCEHIVGDMRTLRLGRSFDAVLIHDAICYMTTEDDLHRAIETAAVHTRAGGVALFAPDYVRETFEPATRHGGSDGPSGRGRAMRYLEWVWDPDPDDTTYLVDYAYLLREGNAEPRVVHDRHVEGLFPRATWRRIIEEGGFEIRTASHMLTVDPDEPIGELFIGVRT